MQVVTVWSWEDEPEYPRLVKHIDFISVVFADNKAVGFTSAGMPSEIIKNDLKKYEILLFGHDPLNPDSCILIRDGMIHK